MAELVIGRRFNGPPSSANGGYTAGAIVEEVRRTSRWAGDLTVRLLKPPPLDVPLALVEAHGTVEAHAGDRSGEVVAVARREGPASWTSTPPVTVADARAVEGSYPGLRAHPFPTCFSCGPGREPGEGLRIFPGRLPDGRVASTWTPHTSVAGPGGAVGTAVTWAALDCVGGWSSDLEHRPLVLAEMCARVGGPPRAGTTYVVVGSLRRARGRKTWTSSAMFDGDRLVGQAEQLWLAVDWAVVKLLQEA
jgi:hypothetical protein